MNDNSERICVIGNSGSGKSSLAKALGTEFGIPVFHLDRELLHGNFKKHPLEKRTELHEILIDRDSWVIDGNYDKLMERRIQWATLVIFLDAGRVKSFWRSIHRAFRKGGQPAETVPDGARRNQLSWRFLIWILRYDRRERIAYLKDVCEIYGVTLLLMPDYPTDDQVEITKNLISQFPITES